MPNNFQTQEAARAFLEKNIDAQLQCCRFNKKPAKKAPAAPFTTSTLQQEAARKLYFSVGKTMTIAQRLYEAGLITYMRTDSVNLSNDAQQAAAKEILKALERLTAILENIKASLKEHKRLMRQLDLHECHAIGY